MKHNFLPLLFVLLNTCSCSFDIPIERSIRNELLINICVGTPCQKLKFKLITSSNMFWFANKNMYNHGYNPFKSRSIHQITTPYHLSYKKQDLVCALIDETISFESDKDVITADKVMAYLAEKGDIGNDYDGVIGIGITNNQDRTQSFFDILRNSNQIEKQIVKISRDKVSFGDIKNDSTVKYCDYIFDAHTIVTKKYQCELEMIYISNNKELKRLRDETPYKEIIDLSMNKVTFKLGANIILAPEEYFTFIIESIFSDLLSNRLCFISKEGSLKYLACSRSVKDNKILSTVNFVINKLTLRFKANDLFIDAGDDKHILFEIMTEDTDENREQFSFGLTILKKYSLILDNENKKVGFVRE